LIKEGKRDHIYEGKAWRDGLDDLEEAMEIEAEGESDSPWEELGRKPAYFRMRLRLVVYAGWRQALKGHPILNPNGCRRELPAPHEDSKDRLQHDLPTGDCGRAGNCGVLDFVKSNELALLKLRDRSAKSKAAKKKTERERRVTGINDLIAAAGGADGAFSGERCHNCGDAMICAEAGAATVVTKDNEYTGLMKVLGGKAVIVKHVG
jgi:hypothetical protein